VAAEHDSMAGFLILFSVLYPNLHMVLWFAAHLEHRCKNEKAKLVIQEQTTTPQVLHKPWCGLL
jgi:hypothetical protein